MRLFRNHWYDIALVLAIAVLVWQAFAGYTGVRLALLLNLVAIFLHQFEEYRLPGGEPWILNEAFQRRGGPADVYPLNQGNAAFMNVFAWPFYALPAFIPDVVWVGLAPVLVGFAQLLVHGIINNRRLKTLYNPGLAAVALGHVPVGIWYLVLVYQQNLITGWDWLWGTLYAVLSLGLVMGLIGYRVMVTKDPKWAFTAEEMNRFGRLRRLKHAGLEPLPMSRVNG